MESPSAPPRRFWATVSLLAGGLWLAFSLAPFFITTLLGLPLAALTFGAAWFARPGRPGGRDEVSARRAAWGLGLGCAGCLWQIVYFGFFGGALLLSLPGLLEYVQKAFPTSLP